MIAPHSRIESLDLIRGIAVLGILAVNISGFSGPMAATYSPHVIGPASPADEWAFAAMLVLFEGKMRALFSILFGASLLLFVERADDAGRDGQTLQLKRLGWLALIGYLHFLLLWWGDILLLYAMAGLAALALRQMPARALLMAALMIFAAWQANGLAHSLPDALARPAAASPDINSPAIAREMAEYRTGFLDQVATRLDDRPFFPVRVAFFSLGETIPYMLIGMLLMQSGFFSGGWSKRRLAVLAGAGIGLGGAASLIFGLWAKAAHFPYTAMVSAINHGLSLPHLAMALGYAAALVLASRWLLARAPGRWLAAAGRMALSNYLGTTIVMTMIFQGWGLGQIGHFGTLAQAGFVLLGWALMLSWSTPWLERYRQGPFEWAWRSLTEGRLLANRR